MSSEGIDLYVADLEGQKKANVGNWGERKWRIVPGVQTPGFEAPSNNIDAVSLCITCAFDYRSSEIIVVKEIADTHRRRGRTEAQETIIQTRRLKPAAWEEARGRRNDYSRRTPRQARRHIRGKRKLARTSPLDTREFARHACRRYPSSLDDEIARRIAAAPCHDGP